MSDPAKVYQAISAVQKDLAAIGIAKDRTAETGGSGKYKFRGIDDVYNALSPLLAKHGLCILPRMLNRQVVERQSSKGNALFYVTVDAEFDLVAAADGSKHTVRTFGEAMDSGDKATNKAMSAAYKYAAFQSFAIPTEGDNDTENQTHEVKPAERKFPSPVTSSMEGETYDAETNARMHKICSSLVDLVNDDLGDTDYAIWELVEPLTNEEKLLLWSLLAKHSKVRAKVKSVSDEMRKKAA